MRDCMSVARGRKTCSSIANVAARFCAVINAIYAVRGLTVLLLCLTESYGTNMHEKLQLCAKSVIPGLLEIHRCPLDKPVTAR